MLTYGDICVKINPTILRTRSPMATELHVNKHLSDTELERIKKIGSDDSPILFALVGDVTPDGKYGRSTIAVSSNDLTVFDLDSGNVYERIRFSDIETIFAKRMYGNAFIRVRMNGEKEYRNIFRYTFSIAALCDSLILFVKNINNGEKLEFQIEVIAAAYEKQLSVCPKCGRTLSAPGVKCINCESKRKIISRLSVYMKPELLPMIISVLLSIITTTLVLIPPYLTRTLVDDILIDGNRASSTIFLFGKFELNAQTSLIIIGVLLAAMLIIRHGLGAIRGYMLRKSGDRIVKALRNDVYEHAQHLPMRFYDKTSTGSVINRISGDSSCSRLCFESRRRLSYSSSR